MDVIIKKKFGHFLHEFKVTEYQSIIKFLRQVLIDYDENPFKLLEYTNHLFQSQKPSDTTVPNRINPEPEQHETHDVSTNLILEQSSARATGNDLDSTHPIDEANISKTQSNVNQYVCDVCSRVFTSKHHLTCHLRLHNGEKPFTCDQCGKPFAFERYLVDHYRIHTGEKPYECRICLKRFTHRSGLKNHLKTHSNRQEVDFKTENSDMQPTQSTSLNDFTDQSLLFPSDHDFDEPSPFYGQSDSDSDKESSKKQKVS
jgi:uncharacterized Zn-finger protein